METDDRIAHLESDIKVLKNEVQSVLLDLRDKYLEADNPFNAPSPPANPQQIILGQAPAANEARPNVEPHSNSVKRDGRDQIQEPAGELDAGKEPHPQTPREEMIQAQVAEGVPNNNRLQKKHIPGREINLITIGGLVNWADESVKQLGHQRTETILDVAEMMGLLSPELKHIMTKFISTDRDGNTESLSARAFLNSLVKITTLLGKDNQTEEALLAILSGEDGHG